MRKQVRVHGVPIGCRANFLSCVFTDAAIVQEEDRFRLDRLAVEQTLAQVPPVNLFVADWVFLQSLAACCVPAV